jgi:hypothetical protein
MTEPQGVPLHSRQTTGLCPGAMSVCPSAALAVFASPWPMAWRVDGVGPPTSSSSCPRACPGASLHLHGCPRAGGGVARPGGHSGRRLGASSHCSWSCRVGCGTLHSLDELERLRHPGEPATGGCVPCPVLVTGLRQRARLAWP